MRRVEDQLGRAVVLLELHDGRLGPVALEVEDVAQVGAAPRVDRLVVIAHHGEIAVFRGEGADPQVLRAVRVLVLVDVEVAPLVLVLGEDGGRLLEQPDAFEQEVVEVERVRLAQALLVAGREAGDHPLAVVRGLFDEEGRIEHLVLGPADRAEDRARAEFPGERQVLLFEDLLHQGLLIVGVVDDEPPADPDRLALLAKDTGIQRVERPRLDVPAGLADQRDDPLAELGRRPVGERDGEDLPRSHAVHADEVRDPVGEDPGLARSGAGEDQQRALGGRDGPCLLGIEGLDDLVGPLLAARRDHRRVGGRDRDGWVVAETRRVAHPGRFLERDRGLIEVGEGRSDRIGRVAAASSSGGSPGRRRRVGLTAPL